jgi:hypothetical protein
MLEDWYHQSGFEREDVRDSTRRKPPARTLAISKGHCKINCSLTFASAMVILGEVLRVSS